MRIPTLALILCGVMPALAAPEDLPYPQGRRFPLGLYSIGSVEEMKQEQAFGWNIAHTYSMKPEYLGIVKEAGWLALAHLAKADEAATKATIADLVSRGPVGWWDLPEEQRWWVEEEYQTVKNLAAWTRKHDPEKRPNFMYNAGHYQAEALGKYMPYLDIIGAGTYTEYAHMPRAWVRWRTEETIRGIEQAGARIGPDYLNGEKTPIGIPMLFANLQQMDVISPVEAYHDFYSCLCSGAKGILVFSYWHKRDVDVLQKSYEAYAKAASEVSGETGLGEALLFGEQVPVTFEISEGPQVGPAFRPFGVKEDVCLPSLNVRAVRYNGKLFVIAVNSTEQALKVTVKGVPAGVKEMTLPFEKALGEDKKPTEAQRVLTVREGGFEDGLGWLGVHVYVAGL